MGFCIVHLVFVFNEKKNDEIVEPADAHPHHVAEGARRRDPRRRRLSAGAAAAAQEHVALEGPSAGRSCGKSVFFNFMAPSEANVRT